MLSTPVTITVHDVVFPLEAFDIPLPTGRVFHCQAHSRMEAMELCIAELSTWLHVDRVQALEYHDQNEGESI